MSSEQMRAAILSAAILAVAVPGSTSSFKAVSREFSRAAVGAGLERVAVLPFVALDGSDPSRGRLIAARLTNAIARRGEVGVVERGLLPAVMEEMQMLTTGAFDENSGARLGSLQQAQAVIVGTLVSLDGQVEVHARLIHVESGMVLASHSSLLKMEALSSGPVASLSGMGPWEQTRAAASDPPDAATDDSCEHACQQIDDIQRDILDLKVRYWVVQIRKSGVSLERMRQQLSKMMSDPGLRLLFSRRLQLASTQSVSPLTEDEVKYFVRKDAEAFLIHLRCKTWLPGSLPTDAPLEARRHR